MHSIGRRGLLLAMPLLTVAAAQGQIAGSWVGGGSGVWNAGNNWSSNPLFPTGEGTAVFNTGAASVSVGPSIQLKHVKFDTPAQVSLTASSIQFTAPALIEAARSKQSAPGTHYYTGHDIAVGVSAGFPSQLHFTGPAAVTLSASNGLSSSALVDGGVQLGITTSLALGSSSGSIQIDNATLRTISSTGTFTATAIDIARAIQVLPSGGTLAGITAPLRINQQIQGGGALTFAGPSGVRLDSTVNWAGHGRIVGGGTSGLTISTSGALPFYNSLTVGGQLTANYGSGANDRLGAGTLTLRGGTVTLIGSNSSVETVGTIVLAGGQNTIALPGTSGTFTLNAAQLRREERGTLRIVADGLGGTSGFGRVNRVFFNDSSNIPLIGGGGAAGSTNASIIPLAHAVSIFGSPHTFVTYDANGLRALDMSEFHQDFPVDLISTANVRTSVNVGNEARTVNSLLHGGLPQSIGGPGTLTITSGAMMGAGAGSFAGFISCPVHFPGEGLITNMHVSGPISGSDGVTISGTSSLSIGDSTYTGTTTINDGTLFVSLQNDLVPGQPGLFGADTSPIVLMGRGTGATLQVAPNGRTFGRDLLVKSDPELLRGNEPALRMLSPNGTFSGAIHLEGPLRVEGSPIIQFTGPITGPGRLVLASTGNFTAILSGSSNFSGGVHAQNGTLMALSDSALGTGTVYLGDGPAGNSISTLSVGTVALGPARTLSNPIVLLDHVFLSASNIASAGPMVLNGAIDLNGEQRSLTANGARVTFNGPISGGELRWGGEGTLAGNNSQLATYLAVAPANFSRITVTSNNGLGGVHTRLTQVGSLGSSNTTRLELRGGVDIPAHPLQLFGTLQNGAGNNIWRGPVNALGSPTFTITADALSVAGGIFSPGTPPGTIRKDGGGTLAAKFIRVDQTLNLLAGTVRSLPDGSNAATSMLGALSIAGAADNWLATFDLADNALAIAQVAAPADLFNQIKSGYAGGSWNGAGFQSSIAAANPQRNTGIGYAMGADLFTTFPADFAGVMVQADTTLLRYTLYGDTNLDRIVDIGDFALLGANFNAIDSTWLRGDFNYDGLTDIGDFALLAANFNQSLTVGLPRTSVPEPSTTVAIVIAPLAVRRRRY